MKFTNIQTLGLKVIRTDHGIINGLEDNYVDAEELEKLLTNSGTVYGRIPTEGAYIQDLSIDQNANHTHKFKSIMMEVIKPLEVSITRQSFKAAVERAHHRPFCDDDFVLIYKELGL